MKKNSSSVQRFVFFLSETTDVDSAGEKSMLEMQSTHEYIKVIDSEFLDTLRHIHVPMSLTNLDTTDNLCKFLNIFMSVLVNLEKC